MSGVSIVSMILSDPDSLAKLAEAITGVQADRRAQLPPAEELAAQFLADIPPDLSAGRDLDRLVAERVMGYTVYHYDKDIEANCYYRLMDGGFDPVVFGWGAGNRKTEAAAWADCPAFSTDVAAAFLVVERMRQHKDFGNLRLVAYSYSRTYATFDSGAELDDTEGWSEANGEDATPTAICLAALAACPEGADVWRPEPAFMMEGE